MAHNNYYLDLCVETYIVNDKAVLLRYHDKYNYWNAPGGHIDAGEDVNEAALRECLEEVGLTVQLVGPVGWEQIDTDFNRDLVPPLFVNRHHITESHDHSCFIFAATSDTRDINPQLDKDILSAAPCRWVTQKELDDMMEKGELLPEIYRYCCKALAVVG